MIEFDQPATARLRWYSARSSVRFLDNLDIPQLDPVHHQQAEMLDEKRAELVVADRAIRDIEPETLRTQAATVEKGQLGIEDCTVLGHSPNFPYSEAGRRVPL